MWERCCVYSERERERREKDMVRCCQDATGRRHPSKEKLFGVEIHVFLLSYFEIVLNCARTAQLDINQKLNDTVQRQQWNKEVK